MVFTESSTAVNVSLFSKIDHMQMVSILRIYQIENRDISLRDASLSQLTSLQSLFYIYGLDKHYQGKSFSSSVVQSIKSHMIGYTVNYNMITLYLETTAIIITVFNSACNE